jgi:hypothetical protein
MAKEDNFNDIDIDIDRSGKLDSKELDIFYGKMNYMDIADLNSDEELDYLEFERLKLIVSKKLGSLDLTVNESYFTFPKQHEENALIPFSIIE